MNWPASSAFRFASVSLFSATLLFAAAGCEDPNDLGVELPGTTPVSTEYRDFPVTASTVLQTPVETLNSNHFLVGRVQDTKLGTTVAKSYLNLQALLAGSAYVPSQYNNPILDSVVVVASFDQVYGSTTEPVSFSVYRLGSPLSDQGTYNSTTVIPPNTLIPLGLDLKSSLNRTKVVQQVNGLKTKNQLDSTTSVTVPDRSVRLTVFRKAAGTLPAVPSPFLENLFTLIKDKDNPFTQTILNSQWKGIAVLPSDNFAGSIVAFNRALENRVYFYYHVDGADATPVPYPISFESTAATAANAPRAFTNVQTQLASPFNQLTDVSKSVPSTVTDNTTYIQEGLGLGTKIEIPGLTELISNREGLAINRAELIVPLKPYTNVVFPAPQQAFLYELDASNKILQRIINISPYERLVQADGANQQGVGTNAQAILYNVSPSNKYYSLNMTSYVQSYVYDILGAERPAALMLYPVVRYSQSSLELTLNRAVLDAQNIKLRVYFSKLR